MKARAFFSNITGNIRLEVADTDKYERHYFTSTSDLLAYCNKNNIILAVEDCVTGW